MTSFIEALWGSFPRTDRGTYGEFRLIREGKIEQWFSNINTVGYQSHRYDDLFLQDNAGWDIFFGVLPRIVEEGTAGATESEVHVLWADVDAKSHDADKAQALFAIGSANLTPSILVDSGNGWHAYWLLREPVGFPDAQNAMRGLAKALGGDHVYDAARILRLPGTHNHKSDPPKPVRLLHFDPNRKYRFSDFVDYIEVEPSRDTPRRQWLAGMDVWEPSHENSPKFDEGGRNNNLTRLAGIMVTKGLRGRDLLVALSVENQIRCDPPLPEREVEAIANSMRRYG